MADKCMHASCSCPAPAGSDFCSDYCSRDEDDLAIGCCCEHSACQVKAATSEAAELREALE